MTDHLITCHQNEDPQSLIKITILEKCQDQATAKELEAYWSFKLFSYYPNGLNIRDESTNF